MSTDPLADLLATAEHTDDCGHLPIGGYGFCNATADRLMTRIPPDQADAMRAGLLIPDDPDLQLSMVRRPWAEPDDRWHTSAEQWRAGEYRGEIVSATGPTLLAALTDLLGKLRGEA